MVLKQIVVVFCNLDVGPLYLVAGVFVSQSFTDESEMEAFHVK